MPNIKKCFEKCCPCCRPNRTPPYEPIGNEPSMIINYDALQIERLYDVWLLYDYPITPHGIPTFRTIPTVTNLLEWVAMNNREDEVLTHLEQTRILGKGKHVPTSCHRVAAGQEEEFPHGIALQIRDVGELHYDDDRRMKTTWEELNKMGRPDCLMYFFEVRDSDNKGNFFGLGPKLLENLKAFKPKHERKMKIVIVITNETITFKERERYLQNEIQAWTREAKYGPAKWDNRLYNAKNAATPWEVCLLSKNDAATQDLPRDFFNTIMRYLELPRDGEMLLETRVQKYKDIQPDKDLRTNYWSGKDDDSGREASWSN